MGKEGGTWSNPFDDGGGDCNDDALLAWVPWGGLWRGISARLSRCSVPFGGGQVNCGLVAPFADALLTVCMERLIDSACTWVHQAYCFYTDSEAEQWFI